MTLGTVICDLDGVVFVDGHPIPGAEEALSSLDEDGYQLLFVTNNATTHRADLVTKIEKASGYRPGLEDVFSSAMAGAALISGEVSTAFVVGEAGLVTTLGDSGIRVTEAWREAEAVVVGLDRALTYARLKDAVLAVGNGARFIATNTDSTYPTPEGLWPGGGAIVAAIEKASGVAPEVAGKPNEPMRAMVRGSVGEGPVWMVGDRPDTDLAMGKLEEWRTVLVLTGVTASAGDVPSEFAPDVVLKSIAELPAAIRR